MGFRGKHCLCGCLALPGQPLPHTVEAVDLFGQGAGGRFVCGREKVQGEAGVSESSGRIEAWRQGKAYRLCGNLFWLGSGDGHQRLEAGAAAGAYGSEAAAYEVTVLAEKGHHVSDRP